MKKLLLAILLIGTVATVNAQKAVGPRGNEEQLALVSKTNELEASLIRNQPQMLQTALPAVTGMMRDHLKRTSLNIQTLNGKEKEDMIDKVKKETVLLDAFQKLAVDPVKNKKELVSKARAFIEVF